MVACWRGPSSTPPQVSRKLLHQVGGLSRTAAIADAPTSRISWRRHRRRIPERELLAVEHLCYVVNAERGVRMLGGPTAVARASTSGSNDGVLQCSLRPMTRFNTRCLASALRRRDLSSRSRVAVSHVVRKEERQQQQEQRAPQAVGHHWSPQRSLARGRELSLRGPRRLPVREQPCRARGARQPAASSRRGLRHPREPRSSGGERDAFPWRSSHGTTHRTILYRGLARRSTT